MNPINRDRKYRGFLSPLEYFTQHSELHGLNRFELSKKDSGLYRALLRHEMLDQVIPEVFPFEKGRPPLSEEARENILVEYHHCDGNISAISRQTGFSTPTITKYLREESLQSKGKGGWRVISLEDRIKMRNAFTVCKGNVSKVSRQTGFSIPTINKYCKDL
jgi:transcriptional regulator of acetoin/glycerol metabolism